MFMSDYTLLEETARAAAAAERGVMLVHESGAARTKRGVLAREAARRGVHLYLMPLGFARRVRNSSHVRGKRDRRELHWHVDVVFKGPSNERCVFVDACAESTTIYDLVAGAREALLRRRKRSCTRHIAQGAHAAGFLEASLDQLDVFIRNEHSIGTQDPDHIPVEGKAIGDEDMHRYLQIDKAKTLESVLIHRVIVEFPVFLVAIGSTQESTSLKQSMMGVFEKPEPDSESSDYQTSDSSGSDESDHAKPEEAKVDPPPMAKRAAEGARFSLDGLADADFQPPKRIRLEGSSAEALTHHQVDSEEMGLEPLLRDKDTGSNSRIDKPRNAQHRREHTIFSEDRLQEFDQSDTVLRQGRRAEDKNLKLANADLILKPNSSMVNSQHEFVSSLESEDSLPPIPRVRAQVPSA
jgi:hypothetical protein